LSKEAADYVTVQAWGYEQELSASETMNGGFAPATSPRFVERGRRGVKLRALENLDRILDVSLKHLLDSILIS
jgi:hypothetical protein